MESATEGFWVYDSDMRLLEVNNAVMQMMPKGIEKFDLIGKHITEFAPDVDRNYYDLFRRVLETGEPLSMDDSSSLGPTFSCTRFKLLFGLNRVQRMVIKLSLFGKSR